MDSRAALIAMLALAGKRNEQAEAHVTDCIEKHRCTNQFERGGEIVDCDNTIVGDEQSRRHLCGRCVRILYSTTRAMSPEERLAEEQRWVSNGWLVRPGEVRERQTGKSMIRPARKRKGA